MENTSTLTLQTMKGGTIMKKQLLLVITSLFLLVSLFSFAVAEETDQDLDLVEVKDVSFFENFFDRLELSLTFNKEKKIEKALHLAEKRLAEAEALADEDPEAAAVARQRYDEFVAKAEAALEDLADEEVNSDEASKEQLSQYLRAQNKLEEHRERTDAMYLRLVERLEEQNVDNETLERLEEFYQLSLKRLDLAEERLNQRKENAKIRYKVITGESDEDVEELENELENETGLTDAQLKRIARAEWRIEKFSEIRDRQADKFRIRLESDRLTDAQKERLELRIEREEDRKGAYADLARRTQARIKERIREDHGDGSDDGDDMDNNETDDDVDDMGLNETDDDDDNETGIECIISTPMCAQGYEIEAYMDDEGCEQFTCVLSDTNQTDNNSTNSTA